MPKISAWECPKTGQLFKGKSTYLDHLKILAKISIRKRADNHRIEVKDAFFANLRSKVATASELKDTITQNWEKFVMNGIDGAWTIDDPRREKYMRECKMPQLLQLDLNLGDYRLCSNEHNAPFGKERNWNQKPELPGGYMGWGGYFSWVVDGDFPFFPSDVFKNTGVGTCGGSGGCGRYCGGIVLFADDWPLMKAEAENHMVISRLIDDQVEAVKFL